MKAKSHVDTNGHAYDLNLLELAEMADNDQPDESSVSTSQ